MQRDCFEVYALVPGLLREEVRMAFKHVFTLSFTIHIIFSDGYNKGLGFKGTLHGDSCPPIVMSCTRTTCISVCGTVK